MFGKTFEKYLLLFFGAFIFVDSIRLHFRTAKLSGGHLNLLWYISYIPMALGALFFLSGLMIKAEGQKKLSDIILGIATSIVLAVILMCTLRL